MKIDLATLRVPQGDVADELANLIERLKAIPTNDELATEVRKIREWPTLHGKSELTRWAELLNRCDDIFEEATKIVEYRLVVDRDARIKSNVMAALHFSTLIFENTSSRSAYSSMDRLLALLESSNLEVVNEVLHFLQMMSKRSRYLSTRLQPELQKRLVERLIAITECWGGKLRNIPLESVVKKDLRLTEPLFPFNFTNSAGQTMVIDLPMPDRPLLEVVEDIGKRLDLDESDRCSLVARLRLLRDFSDYEHRMDSLVARLLGMSTLLYSRCGDESVHTTLLPPRFVEETCDILRLDVNIHPMIDEIKAEALRALTAIISNDSKPSRFVPTRATEERLSIIMEKLGATSYHGFLATFTRECVEDLKGGRIGQEGAVSVKLCTALFSLLYHMSSLEHPRTNRGNGPPESLITAGITQTMLSIVSFHELPVEMVAFVTRCVRVIDIVSAVDVAGFIANKGMETCVDRLVFEINECRKEQPYEIDVAGDVEGQAPPPYIKTVVTFPKKQCNHQRGALIKSLLNFLKRVINEREFVDLVRHLMDGALPDALRHIFSNMDYYSGSLFHNSMQLVQNFVYQEPALLSLLQTKHVPYTILMGVLRKDMTPYREVVSSMAQVFCALCLNERGLAQFKLFSPFEEMLKIMLTSKYITLLKKRRNDLNDCYTIGTTFDDLLRQHSSLRDLCLDSFTKTLTKLCEMGTTMPNRNIRVVMTLARSKHAAAAAAARGFDADDREDSVGVMSPRPLGDEGESEDEEDIVDVIDEVPSPPGSSEPSSPHPTPMMPGARDMTAPDPLGNGRVLPLGDYLGITTRIIEQVLTASSPSVEMVEGFNNRGGVRLLLESTKLPLLRSELAASTYPATVANIIRHVLFQQHSQKKEVMKMLTKWGAESFEPLAGVLNRTTPEGTIPPGVSLVGHLSVDEMTEMVSNAANAANALSGLMKGAAILPSPRDPEVRNKVVALWSEEGPGSMHALLHKVYTVLTWEHAVMTAMRTMTKTPESELRKTKAGSADPSVAMETEQTEAESSGSPASDSVQIGSEVTQSASGVPKQSYAEAAGLTPREFGFYVNNRDVQKLLAKAYKAVSELLSYFSRVCVGVSPRARHRAYDTHQYQMSRPAAMLISAFFREAKTALEYVPPGYDAAMPIRALYLTEMLSSLSSTMMDEKKMLYHHILAKFFSTGCYSALFSILYDYLVPKLQERVFHRPIEGLFHEWFKFISRLSNRQTLLLSRYKLPDPASRQFPINKFYRVVLVDIFNALHSLIPVIESAEDFAITRSTKATDDVLDLLTDVTKNLAALQEEVSAPPEADQAAGGPSASGADAVAERPTLDPRNVTTLMDMGFDRTAVMTALLEHRNVTEAMEYLLNERSQIVAANDPDAMFLAYVPGQGGTLHIRSNSNDEEGLLPPPDMEVASTSNASAPSGADAASSGADGPSTSASAPGSMEGSSDAAAPTTSTAREPIVEEQLKDVKIDWDEMVSRIINGWIPLTMTMAKVFRGSPCDNRVIYHAAELTKTVAASASEEWRRETLINGIIRSEILNRYAMLKTNLSSPSAIYSLYTYIHFACLVFDSLVVDYLAVMQKPGNSLVPVFLDMINLIGANTGNELLSASLLSPALLWLDLYDKNTRFGRSLAQFAALGIDQLTFYSYGLEERGYATSRPKWVQYPPHVCTQLTKALLSGRTVVTIRLGRREVLVDLVEMVQRSELSSDKMAISVVLRPEDKEKLCPEEVIKVEQQPVFSESEMETLISSIVSLLSKSHVPSFGAHSALQLLTRITRDEAVAQRFIELGGVAAVLQVRGTSVPYTNALFAQLLRHCIEDSTIIDYQYDKMMRKVCTSGAPSAAYSSRWPHGNLKDYFCASSFLGVTASRSPALYMSNLMKLTKVEKGLIALQQPTTTTTTTTTTSTSTLPPSAPTASTASASAQASASAGPSTSSAPSASAITRLSAEEAARKAVDFAEASLAAKKEEEKREKEREKNLHSKHAEMVLELLLSEVVSGDWSVDEVKQSQSSTAAFRLFSRASILYIMAELVRSYPFMACLLTNFNDGQTSLLHKMMDKYSDPSIEKDSTTGLHVLLAAVAASGSAKGQERVLSDISTCLAGFSQQPQDHTNIHLKIAELANVVSSMVTACPATAHPKDTRPLRHPTTPSYHTNNVVKLVVKKRILNDLVRCVTRLVLSKRESIETTNVVIRTVDDLAKACNLTTAMQPALRPYRIADAGAARLAPIQAVEAERAERAADGATVRRVDVNTHGDVTETVVRIDMHVGGGHRNADLLEDVVNAAVAAVNRQNTDADDDRDAASRRAVEDEPMEEGGSRDDEDDDAGAMSSASSALDEHVDEGGMMEIEEHVEDVEDEDEGDEDGHHHHHHVDDDMLAGDETMHSDEDEEEEEGDDDEDDDGEDEEEDDDGEGAARDRAEIAMASASAGGEEGERTAEEEEEEGESDLDDDFPLFDEATFDRGFDRDMDLLQRVFVEMRDTPGVALGIREDRYRDFQDFFDPIFDTLGAGRFQEGRYYSIMGDVPARAPYTAAPHASVHPLMQNPPRDGSDIVSANARAASNHLHIFQPPNAIRMHIANQGRHRTQLIRQNAVRRNPVLLATRDGSMVDEMARRAMDMRTSAWSAWPRHAPGFGGTPTGLDSFIDENTGVYHDERPQRMTAAGLSECCPTTIDRLREVGRLLDGMGGLLVAMAINSAHYYKWKDIEEAEAAATREAEARRAIEAAKQRAEEEERAARNEADATHADADADDIGELMLDVPGEQPMEEDEPSTVTAASFSERGSRSEAGMETEGTTDTATDDVTTATAPELQREEPTTNEEGTSGLNDGRAPVEDEEPPDLSALRETNDEEPTSTLLASDQLAEMADRLTRMAAQESASAVVASSTVEEASTSAVTTEGEANEGGEGEGETREEGAPAPGMQLVPEEYVEVLGAREIPEGVDPAFLAALPDDMRAEVLRDHERSQRAQRAAERPANPVAASAPGVEPLDQEFLNALPPELQEEILQQHERAVRAAEAAAAAPAPVDPEVAAAAAAVDDNPAEVIRSLPPTLRAQVLADADDTVLQVLPAELADEARRLRQERGHAMRSTNHSRIMRLQEMELMQLLSERDIPQRLIMRGAPGGSGGARATMRGAGGAAGASATNGGTLVTSSGVGLMAGTTVTASAKGVQMMDRDSVAALIMLFFADSRLNTQRLQRTLRDLCQHKGTCDYIIHSLIAVLRTCMQKNDDVVQQAPSWTDSLTVSGVGHNEKAVRIGKDGKTFVHPLFAPIIARYVVELLVTIARLFPGHFVPHALRKDATRPESGVRPPPLTAFWTTVQAYTTSKPTATKEPMPEFLIETLEESPMAHLMSLLACHSLADNVALHEKIVKLLYTIVQTLPDDTLNKLDKEDVPLSQQLELVCKFLTSGTCSTEALQDGRMLLVEAMRAMGFKTTMPIYEMIIGRIQELGTQLQPQISSMLRELAVVPEGSTSVQASSSTAPGPSSASTSGTNLSGSPSRRYDADLSRENRRRTEMERENLFYALQTIRQDNRMTISSCAELQVPSVRQLTEKGGVQNALLSSLQTICKVRDTLNLLVADKNKRTEDEAKKKFEAAAYDDAERKRAEDMAKKTAKMEEELTKMKETTEEATPSTSTESGAEGTTSTTSTTSTNQTTTEVAGTSTEEKAPEATDKVGSPPKMEDFTDGSKITVPEIVLSQKLETLEPLWEVLSDCLQRLGKASDPHAVLALQPAAEAFFLVHSVSTEKARELSQSQTRESVDGTPATVSAPDEDTAKLLQFAEKHRSVLNQVLRQNNTTLSDGPFACLTCFPKLLDFDVKRSYFRKQLTKMDDRQRYRRDDVPLRVSRARIFSDSFRELFRLRGQEWKSRFYIMFEGEEGQDAGGLLREWFSVITREIFNPHYALFTAAPGDRATYMINKASYINPEHIDYFKFVGRIIAKAIHDNKLLDCYFTRAFYKHILNLPVRYQDLESEDPEFYKSLVYLLQNPVEHLGLDLTFTLDVDEFGVSSVRPLKEGGDQTPVTDENKEEYVRLVCQMKMTGSIRRQLDAFLEGFYEVIPKTLIAMFNEQELELLISGLPDVDIDDLAANTEYRGYNKNSREIQWFWRALRSFEPEDRAKFLQFVTGTSKVPLNGFASLEGMSGVQKFSIHQDSRGGNRLPAAHTCFNQLDLPVYDSYEKLREAVLLAVRECTEGFGFA